MTGVDLAPRMGSLIPLWFVPLAGLIWLTTLALTWWPSRRRRPEVAAELGALGALLIAFLLFFWRPLLTAAEVPNGGGDLNSFFFPLHAFAASQIAQEILPLWNPFLHGGMPQLANFQAGTLYPPNLIAYLLFRPFTYAALERMALGHYLIASLGAYAVVRSLGAGRLGAIAGGIVFPYSGFMVAHLGHYSMLSVVAWLPLLFLAIRLTVLRSSWLWAAGLAVIIFLMATGGHQQALLYSAIAGGVWWAFWVLVRHGLIGEIPRPVLGSALDAPVVERPRSLTGLSRPLLADAARTGCAAAIGLGLAAPMILPSLQLAQLSVRSPLSFEQASEFSVEPIALVQFILPKVFGSNPTDYWGPFSNGEIWVYAGIVTLVLAAIALVVHPSPPRIFLAGLVVFSVLFALGPATPLHGWFFRFAPFFNLIRAPARAYVVTDLALALLAAYGVSEIAARSRSWPERLEGVLRISLRALLAALALLIAFVLPLFYSLILGVNDPSNRPVIAVDNLNLLVLWLALTTVLLWAVLRGRLGGAAAGIAAIALLGTDLFSATASFNPTPNDLVVGYRHPQVVDYLRQQLSVSGPFRIEATAGSWQPDLAAVVGLDDVGGLYDPMEPAGYEAARQAAVANRALPLHDLLNVRYLVTDDKAASPGAKFTAVLRSNDGLVVWENRAAMPRAWLAYQAQQVDLQSALAAIRAPDFNPRTTLYLTGALPTATPDGQGTATVARYTANEVYVRVETDRAAYLVLADTNYPGWQVFIDGQAAPLATADGLFRATSVPAGTHQMVFRFQPPIVRLSAGVSLVGLLGLIALTAFGWQVRRRRRARHL